jgi:hypothetical protein
MWSGGPHYLKRHFKACSCPVLVLCLLLVGSCVSAVQALGACALKQKAFSHDSWWAQAQLGRSEVSASCVRCAKRIVPEQNTKNEVHKGSLIGDCILPLYASIRTLTTRQACRLVLVQWWVCFGLICPSVPAAQTVCACVRACVCVCVCV